MAPAKAITLFILRNAIDTTINIQDKLETESLTDSKVTFVTSNILPTPH